LSLQAIKLLPKPNKAAIIIEMNMKNEYTKKERANLNAKHQWGQRMSFLKAIHRELEPKKAALEEARKFIGIAN
jgi:hypothetical protein